MDYRKGYIKCSGLFYCSNCSFCVTFYPGHLLWRSPLISLSGSWYWGIVAFKNETQKNLVQRKIRIAVPKCTNYSSMPEHGYFTLIEESVCISWILTDLIFLNYICHVLQRTKTIFFKILALWDPLWKRNKRDSWSNNLRKYFLPYPLFVYPRGTIIHERLCLITIFSSLAAKSFFFFE